jgi:hypothetical protein
VVKTQVDPIINQGNQGINSLVQTIPKIILKKVENWKRSNKNSMINTKRLIIKKCRFLIRVAIILNRIFIQFRTN